MLHVKYEFPDKETYDTCKLDIPHVIETDEDSGEDYFTYTSGDCVAVLGNIIITEPTFDEDGNELTAAVHSDKWHVDVLWLTAEAEVESFKEYKVSIDGLGIHGFAGIVYNG